MLAGGQSSRMGRDKAALPFAGSSLLGHRLAALRRDGFEAAVAGLSASFTADWSDGQAPTADVADVLVVADRFPGAGPLAGIEAALHSLPGQNSQPVLFVPVDLPLLPPEFFHALWTRAEQTGAWATVPFALGRPQPLCAIYSSSLAAGMGQALEDGSRKVMQVVQALAPRPYFDTFPVEALAPSHGWEKTHRWFTNLNTPADWDAFSGGHLSGAHLPGRPSGRPCNPA